MHKHVKKLLCAAVCAASVVTIAMAPGCSNYYNKIKLDGNTDGTVTSNGGFVVKKGSYVYFVNGVGDYTEDNGYGDVEKSAIMRISTSDLENGNYLSAEIVVPQIYYSGSYDTGLYIYGDRIYYSTPSTEKNSDGEVQNSYLEFKSANLDGSEAMKGYYYQSSSNSIEYRYVEMPDEDGVDTVYLLYVASESYYDEDDTCTNLHSVNTSTGVDTLLAYNISSYLFDEEDAESGVVYYTMDVTDGLGGDYEIEMEYNQVYRVTANTTSAANDAKGYDFSYIDWDEDEEEEEYPVYTNCGELVLDGIGLLDGKYYSTQFNTYGETSTKYDDEIDHPNFTYALSTFQNGILYYTRTATATMMFTLDDSTVSTDGEDAITRNPEIDDAYLIDGDTASGYKFIDVKGTTMALYTENNRFMLAEVENGEVQTGYCITAAADDSPALIFTEGSYLYYAVSGENDNAIYRVDYTGDKEDYNTLSYYTESDPEYEEAYEYTSVKILDIEYNSSWFIPELIENCLFFASQTDQMGSYNYIMVCDLNNDSGDMMNNLELDELNEMYDDLLETLDDIDADEYANLTNALYYLFYTGDEDYLDDLINAYVVIEEMDEEYLYSKESAQIYHDFAQAVKGDMDWSSYASLYKTINDKTVYSNMRDYYYSVIGLMTDDDYDDYIEDLKSAYMQSYPEDDSTWWENINLAAKISFIVGMCLSGILVIGAAVILTVGLIKRYKHKKVVEAIGDEKLGIDITDDKSINVYENDTPAPEEDKKDE